MDGRAELTPRGRSQRERRPPKAYQGALSWEAAGRLKLEGRVPDGGEEYGNHQELEGVEESGKEVAAEDLISEDEMSMDEYDGNTSDEFIPENDRLDQERRRAEEGRIQENDFDSDSGEEFGESDRSEESDENADGTLASRRDPVIDPRFSQQDLETAKKQKKPTLNQFLRYGGLENPEAWKQVGQRNRQKQKEVREARVSVSPDEDGDMGVEEGELQ
jgi:hypothetical protein